MRCNHDLLGPEKVSKFILIQKYKDQCLQCVTPHLGKPEFVFKEVGGGGVTYFQWRNTGTKPHLTVAIGPFCVRSLGNTVAQTYFKKNERRSVSVKWNVPLILLRRRGQSTPTLHEWHQLVKKLLKGYTSPQWLSDSRLLLWAGGTNYNEKKVLVKELLCWMNPR